jgi:hypothetical protein
MGGWVGADECDAYFEDIIQNFYKGHHWLSEEFGISPRVGWNIDAFGHTEANAAIFHDLGFEALFMSRLAEADLKNRFKPETHSSHFLWRPQASHFGAHK